MGGGGGGGRGGICDQTPLSIVWPGFQYGEACSMKKALDFREHYDYSKGKEQQEESCLEKFSKFLGYPMDGFEDEILDLVQRIDTKRKKGKAKECLTLSKFDRGIKEIKMVSKREGRKE